MLTFWPGCPQLSSYKDSNMVQILFFPLLVENQTARILSQMYILCLYPVSTGPDSFGLHVQLNPSSILQPNCISHQQNDEKKWKVCCDVDRFVCWLSIFACICSASCVYLGIPSIASTKKESVYTFPFHAVQSTMQGCMLVSFSPLLCIVCNEITPSQPCFNGEP